MEHQKKLKLLNKASDSKFVKSNGTFSIISQTQIIM